MASAELSRRGQAVRYRRGDRGEPTAADDLLDLERPEGDVGETAQQFVESCRQELNDKLVPALEDLKSALRTPASGSPGLAATLDRQPAPRVLDRERSQHRVVDARFGKRRQEALGQVRVAAAAAASQLRHLSHVLREQDPLREARLDEVEHESQHALLVVAQL